MYAGRVVCCPLVSHVEYAPRTLLRLEKGRDKVYVYLYSALRKAPLMRSDMNHTVFTCKLHQLPAAEHHRPLAGTHFTVPRGIEG